jgi:hypothetical protein
MRKSDPSSLFELRRGKDAAVGKRKEKRRCEGERVER